MLVIFCYGRRQSSEVDVDMMAEHDAIMFSDYVSTGCCVDDL